MALLTGSICYSMLFGGELVGTSLILSVIVLSLVISWVPKYDLGLVLSFELFLVSISWYWSRSLA